MTSAVSVVLPRAQLAAQRWLAVALARPGRRSSAVLVRLPLWPRATVPAAVAPSVGCAFSQVRAAGRGVAAVADGDVPLQGAQRGLVEDLGDQAHVLVDEDLLAVAGRDAGRLLPAVLQRVEAEVGELGDLLAGGPDAEDAAGVLRALLAGEQVVGQPSVAACHGPSLPQRRTPERSRAGYPHPPAATRPRPLRAVARRRGSRRAAG